MSIRRSLPFVLVGVSLLSAGCGESNGAKGSPGDAVGMGSAEGAAAGTATAEEGTGPGITNQPGTPANDTTPHRPGAAASP